ncbi:MAG: 2-C-methyl-D-erythritol 2,4-cyclodiphosphate synthase [Chitinophagales bacterium]|nr:2-C-methyl-D-erythritol 2,4-cyclodiphosphate synthase [Chitinophagales bacterium]MDW8393786.1 2-C-methyl-D-erythritol 2,4-cyclodiphosphate synthase [Chitinophagales bacterium]
MNTPFRVGLGYDVHRMVAGRPCILGGVQIPSEAGPEGHSDADVLAHALCDALLGAAGLGDIGQHFPNTDARYAGADSMVLLTRVCTMVREAGYQVVNADCVVVAEAPRIAPYVAAMRQRLAEVMQVLPERVSIKATTGEGLGFVGKGEGIVAHAVVLLAAADAFR